MCEKHKSSAHRAQGKTELRIKLRTKLIISYMLLILVLFGLYTGFTFMSINASSSVQLVQAAGHVLDQTRELLNYKFSNVMYASDRLFYDENMNNIIKRDQNLDVGPELMEDLIAIRTLISNASQSSDMYRLTLYLDSSIYYADMYSVTGNSKTRFLNISSVTDEAWFKELQNHKGKALLVKTVSDNSKAPLISSIRFIKDIANFTNILGILRIDIMQKDLDEIVANAVATDGSVAYLQNPAGAIMAASDPSHTERFSISFEDSAKIARKQGEWELITIDKNEMLVGASFIENTDWVLVSILPLGDVQIAGWQIIRATLPVLAAAVLIAFLLSILYSHGFTRRINNLSVKMMAIRDQALPECMEVTGSDEVSMLIKSYNYMISRIRRFSEMQYKLGRDVKSAEYKALQAQIDPHFLYNTLELINWVAMRNKVPEISDIVQDLAKYYKLSLSRGKDTVSIEDAMEHIKTYINLQNFRFKNKLTLVLDISESLYRYGILNLILQPIVENAIFHGIFETPSQIGTITISGALCGDKLILSVRDDGVGMSAETADRVFGSDALEGRGYGVINVNNRVKLYYGNEYGLQCHSAEGEGTTVEIHIPALSVV